MRRYLLRPRTAPGQTLVETALVLPLFLMVVFGIIVFGMGLFYQQEIATVAREAARYAVVHSATSDTCPVGGWLAPDPGTLPDPPPPPWNCDGPAAGWPNMTAYGRSFVYGLDPTLVHVTACWAGYHDRSLDPPVYNQLYDQGPVWANDPTLANWWMDCTMEGGTDPLTQTSSLPCPATTSDGDDTASNLAVSDRQLAVAANRVVVYACYAWTPPLAGFLLIPETVVLRAVISEGLQHQR